MTHRTILAFCPEHYRPDYEYLFVGVAAEFVATAHMWTRVGNTATQFPPEGAVFVPRAMLPEPFRPGDVASWVVQDQPDYLQHNLSTRYRAIRTYYCPAELISIPKTSEDIAGVRKVLLEEGFDSLPGPDGRDILVELSDGWVVGPLALEEKCPLPRKFVVEAQALAQPLKAWKSRAGLPLLKLDWDGKPRYFFNSDSLPQTADHLDFASLEEALRSTHLPGGGGAGRVRSGGPGRVVESGPHRPGRGSVPGPPSSPRTIAGAGPAEQR